MNYIKQLENDLIAMRKALTAYDNALDDVVRYLHSPKFHEDTTVQVQDMLNRISAARMEVVPYLDKCIRARYPEDVP